MRDSWLLVRCRTDGLLGRRRSSSSLGVRRDPFASKVRFYSALPYFSREVFRPIKQRTRPSEGEGAVQACVGFVQGLTEVLDMCGIIASVQIVVTLKACSHLAIPFTKI